ncbi:MAG: hypothetical protein LBR70_02440 [Lactobacillaceae bacterium]|jgi:phage-related tail fiber protein|nr:hypothetical protein [Lactobacillaceae bacterium]
MKKNLFFLLVTIVMAGVFVACGNKNQKPAEPVYETVTVDSETNFEVRIPAAAVASGTTYFVVKDVKGETVTYHNDGSATIKAGEKSYRVYPPEGFELGNMYAKPADKVRDAVYIGTKTGSKSKPYVILADCTRTKKINVSNGAITNSSANVKPVVLDNIVPVKVTKQVLKEPAPAKK